MRVKYFSAYLFSTFLLIGGIVLTNLSLLSNNFAKREFIVVKASGAVLYREPITFSSGYSIEYLLRHFELQQGADLDSVYVRKGSKWIRSESNAIIYEDKTLKVDLKKD